MKTGFNFGLKTSLFYALLAIFAFVGVGSFISLYGGEVYLEGRNALFIKEAQTAARLLSDIPEAVLREQAGVYAMEISQKSGARVTFIDNQGFVLGDSSLDPSTLENHLLRPEVQSALKGQVGLERRYSTTEGVRNLYVAVPVEEEPPVKIVLRMSIPTAVWDSDLGKIQLYSWLAVGGGFAVFLVLGLLFSGIVRKPILEILSALRGFKEGRVTTIRSSRSDEFGLLASEINSLMEKVVSLSIKSSSLEEKWQAYLGSEKEGILVLDPQLKVIQSSLQARQVLNLPERQILGKTLLESTLDHNLASAVERAIQTGSRERVIYDGRTLQIRGSPLKASPDEGAIIWIEDVSEIEALRVMKRDFVTNVSHELKTPVSSLKIMLETILQEPPPSPEVQRDFLSRSLKEVEYLESLINALTRLSLIESGKAQFEVKVFDLRELLGEIFDSLKERALDEGIDFRFEIPEEPLKVRADPLSLREAFLSILDNAFKFTPRGRTVQLQASRQGDWVIVNFRDQGVGISRDDLPRIFERFYKADKGRGTPGFGIGLSLAKHIIENFSGSISVISEEGKGALFIVKLPFSGKEI